MTDVVWPDIEPDFKQQLRSLIPLLLAPEQLVVKKIHGTRISGKQLLEYFKVYIKIYQGDELPEPKSMLEVASSRSLPHAAWRLLGRVELSFFGVNTY